VRDSQVVIEGSGEDELVKVVVAEDMVGGFDDPTSSTLERRAYGRS
jgi:hypothetical protein